MILLSYKIPVQGMKTNLLKKTNDYIKLGFLFAKQGKTCFDTLTGIRLWAQICAHLNLELRKCLITFPIFVPSQRLIARNVRELFSFNRGVSHLNNACHIDDVSRGSLSCYEILRNN
jgi:hypothetical protein